MTREPGADSLPFILRHHLGVREQHGAFQQVVLGAARMALDATTDRA